MKVEVYITPFSTKPNAIEGTVRTIKQIPMQNFDFLYLDQEGRIVGLTDNPYFLKFACEKQGYAQRIEVGFPIVVPKSFMGSQENMNKEEPVDKSSWPEGPWTTEVDRIEWQNQETGFRCRIIRGFLGALCGYVGVPKEHPCYRIPYGKCSHFDVHGGLTYSDFMEEDESLWWLGFDCAHAGDFAPRFPELSMRLQAEYRDLDYVKNEVENLARQLQRKISHD